MKRVSMLLSLCGCFALAGCGGEDPEKARLREALRQKQEEAARAEFIAAESSKFAKESTARWQAELKAQMDAEFEARLAEVQLQKEQEIAGEFEDTKGKRKTTLPETAHSLTQGFGSQRAEREESKDLRVPHSRPLDAEDVRNLDRRARHVRAALDKFDYDTLVGMTHPSVLKLAGGKAKMIELGKAAVAQAQAVSAEVLESKLGDPTEAYIAGDELVCFLPHVTLMRIGEQKVRSIGFLVCVRTLSGGEWLFIDGAPLRKNPEMLKAMLPNIPVDVPLPENRTEMIF